jgi:hypothetical protein
MIVKCVQNERMMSYKDARTEEETLESPLGIIHLVKAHPAVVSSASGPAKRQATRS